MRDLAGHVDQIDRAVAVHRREQRIARLRQRRVVRDQAGAGAPDLLLVDARHAGLPRCCRGRSNRPTPALSDRRYTAEDAVKKIVMALAVVMFAGLFWSQPAEARCWWNGFRWHCTTRITGTITGTRGTGHRAHSLLSAVLLRLLPAILLPARVHALAALLGIDRNRGRRCVPGAGLHTRNTPGDGRASPGGEGRAKPVAATRQIGRQSRSRCPLWQKSIGRSGGAG